MRRGHTASAGGTPRASSRCMSLGSRGASPCLHHRKWKSRPGRGQDLSPGTLAPTGRQRQDPGGDTRDTTLCPRCQGRRGSFPTSSCPPSGTDFSNSQQLMVKIRLKRHPCRRPGRGAPCRSRTPREGPGRGLGGELGPGLLAASRPWEARPRGGRVASLPLEDLQVTPHPWGLDGRPALPSEGAGTSPVTPS